jgi:hypothetical protein
MVARTPSQFHYLPQKRKLHFLSSEDYSFWGKYQFLEEPVYHILAFTTVSNSNVIVLHEVHLIMSVCENISCSRYLPLTLLGITAATRNAEGAVDIKINFQGYDTK